MPECRICGKKFSTLDALEQHHRTVHPKQKFLGAKKPRPKHLTSVLIIALIAVSVVVGALIYQQQAALNKGPAILGQPISPDFLGNITGVSDATLSAIGYQSYVANFTPTGAIPFNTTKPVVLYIGGEFCPFCAVERWAMVVALSHFGNFTGLKYMETPLSEDNLSTLSFYGSNFTSNYITFVGIEYLDRNHNLLMPIPPQYMTVYEQYDPTSAIPFLDINNQYNMTGAQISPGVISGLSWAQIYSQLNDPNSTVAKNIDSAANVLIHTICSVTNGNPPNVCGKPYATAGVQNLPAPVPLSASPGNDSTVYTAASEVGSKWTD